MYGFGEQQVKAQTQNSLLQQIGIYIYIYIYTLIKPSYTHFFSLTNLKLSLVYECIFWCSDCKAACAARCRLSSRPRLCQRACGTCCKRCNCVPPGTSGNQEACPCYASLTTRGGKRKCP